MGRRLFTAFRNSRFTLSAGSLLAALLLRLLARSVRVIFHRRHLVEPFWSRGEAVIYAFWHGRLLMMPFSASRARVAVLISQHRDGEYISRMMERLGLRSIRGSATRGGLKAFKEMIAAVREGSNIAITPDGPKGPARRVKSGVIELARLTGTAIIPLSFGAERRWILKSWDALLIPRPFTRGVFVWGEPLRVDPEADEGEITKMREILAERLDAITREADHFFSEG